LHYYYSRRECFEVIYVKVMVALSILSLPLYGLNFFRDFGFQLQNPAVKSLFFYTSFPVVTNDVIIRNSGMFWEPGAFAGYLIVALLIIVVLNGSFKIELFRREILIITIGIITTLSTMGYLVLGLIILVYIFSNFGIVKYFFASIFIFSMFLTYNNLPFLKAKITDQFQESLDIDESVVSNTRFGSIIMDLQYIESSPWFGNGLHIKTRFRFHPWVDGDIGHGNGMSNFIAFWGIPLFFFWLMMVMRYFKQRLNNWFAVFICFICLLLVLQNEQFLNYPFFSIFFFITLYSTRFRQDESTLGLG